jgi:drug/metabolite transporter (DMT)-like permease
MAGNRFLFAGIIMYGILRFNKEENPPFRMWRSAAVVGAFLLLGGNGAVVWAEQTVPSGITALIVGATPLWMVVLGWLWLREKKPTPCIIAGLVLGFAGLVYLIRPTHTEAPVHLLGAFAVLFASLSWTIGSLSSRKLVLPASPFMVSALEMITGGVMLLIAGLVSGEAAQLDLEGISWQSLTAFMYLTLVGSLVGFSAYIYVLKHSSPALASTYAYVNPVVAVILGWAIAHEPITLRTVIAAVVIIAAVVLITLPDNARL